MVFSYYLYRIPYSIVWHILSLLKLTKQIIFYCGDPIDYYIFNPLQKYLPDVLYATDKSYVRSFLKKRQIAYLELPVFPKIVIMARHSTHKFPCANIIKIGMRHGAYHFKRMTSSDSYNQFNLYLMTSKMDVEMGIRHGVTSGKAIGFPKLDPAFNNEISHEYINALKIEAGIDINKPTVLFSATYNASGMSAINQWYARLYQLTDKWNVLVTLHPWVKTPYKDKIKATPKIYYIFEYYTLPYIMLADVIVGDTSSFLAECCALDKPIVTFKLNSAKRSLDEIEDIINSISYRVKSFDELTDKMDYALNHKNEMSEARAKANSTFFDILDGKAGERAAQEILRLIDKRN